jgi:hypothetical protein
VTDFVYHFTDTAHLPWILRTAELRPGANRIGGYPDPDFVWATINKLGSRKAVGSGPSYRAGCTQLVRFTLHATDFEPWRRIVQRYPAWTPDQIERLEQSGGEPSTLWYCRTDPLLRSRWIEIATKAYTNGTWRSLPMDVAHVSCGDGFLGVVVGGRPYVSRQVDQGEGHPLAYELRL